MIILKKGTEIAKTDKDDVTELTSYLGAFTGRKRNRRKLVESKEISHLIQRPSKINESQEGGGTPALLFVP